MMNFRIFTVSLVLLAAAAAFPAMSADSQPAPPSNCRTVDAGTAEFRVPSILCGDSPGGGTFRLADPLSEGDEFSFHMKVMPRSNLDILIGNRRISWSWENEEGFRTQFVPDVKVGRVQNIYHRIRGVLKDSFSWDDQFAARIRSLHFSHPELSKTTIPVRILRSAGNYEITVNGFFVTSAPMDELSFRYRGMQITDPLLTRLSSPERFRTVDISARKNLRMIFRRKTFPENKTLEINGVPFRLTAPVNGGLNALDLSVSWCPFVNMRGSDGEEFGGRWGGARLNNPSRLQFRVPNDDYTALYVLAATQGSPSFPLDTFTVQFYRPSAGFPQDFRSPAVPGIASAVSDPATQTIIDGKTLSLIRVPLSAGRLKEFSAQDYLEFELTKNTYDYQCYPDPFYYSRHAGGQPSAVKIFAATLEKAPVKISFEPEAVANIWVTGETPAWKVSMENRTGKKRAVRLDLVTKSFDGRETAAAKKEVTIPAHGSAEVRLTAPVKRYGWHSVSLKIDGDGVEYAQDRSLAFLRKQEPTDPALESPEFEFGDWYWGEGGHGGMRSADFFEVGGKAGLTATCFRVPDSWEKEAYAAAKKWNFRTYFIGDFWPTGDYEKNRADSKLQEQKTLEWRRLRAGLPPGTPPPVNDLNRMRFFAFGTEPSFGLYSHGSLPEFYGEAELDPFKDHPEPVAGEVLSASHAAAFERIRAGLKKTIPLVRKDYPNALLMMPWGDPNFCIPFLRDPEIAKNITGVLYDSGVFDRMPEMQLHQTVIHRLWQFRQNWKKWIPDREPLLSSIEGPCFTGVKQNALTEREFAAYVQRAKFLLGAYGMKKQYANGGSGSEPSDYWGEQHYAGGSIGRIPLLNPHVAYAASATVNRHLKKMCSAEAVPFREKSVYGVRFETLNGRESMYALWTIRGERPISFGKKVRVFDLMDNEEQTDHAVISDMPILVYGLDKGLENTAVFGEPSHKDSVNGPHVLKLAEFGDGKWKQIQENDRDYTATAPNYIRRFPAVMGLAVRDGQLEITLPKQEKNRGVMPHYTTLIPAKPILIPGTAVSLNVPVTAHGDWGRILFVLRDAKKEKWISCGVKNEYNCDDTRSLSVFNFEGTRLLKIPLPGNLPWDSYRLNGTASWGTIGGDARVDYPLVIEKVIIERREQFLRVNSLEPASREPVRLGALYAEYDSEAAEKPAAAAIANQREKVSLKPFTEPNPIQELAQRAAAAPGSPAAPSPVSSVEEPHTYNDGTNGIFHFKFHPDAVEYDVYVSRYEDGRGAKKLAGSVKTSQVHVSGFKADTDFYVFLIYRTKDRKQSAPSAGFKFNMKKNFFNL